MKTYFKTPNIRLKGDKLRSLNNYIHNRDNNACIICGREVDIGEKFHHEKRDGLKNDVKQEGVTLCYGCHQERHFGKCASIIKTRCINYLTKLYPNYWS